MSSQELSQLLWAAQGITAGWGGRTSPSAGSLYPLELYVVAPDLFGHYVARDHRVDVLGEKDVRAELAVSALGQEPVRAAALTIVVTAVYERTVRKYGARGRRYAKLEAGHAAQNVLLQVVALGLGAVPIGAFDDRRVADTLRLPDDRAPLYLVAVGEKASQQSSG